MSGYFASTRQRPARDVGRGAGGIVGEDYPGGRQHPAHDYAANNAPDDVAAMFQQFMAAAAAASSDAMLPPTQTHDRMNHHYNPNYPHYPHYPHHPSSQEEEMARMGRMLARLVTSATNNGNDGAQTMKDGSVVAKHDNRSDGNGIGIGRMGASSTAAASTVEEKEASFQRSLFHKEMAGARHAGRNPPRYHHNQQQQQQQQYQHQITSPIPITTDQQKQWYAEERALLRELIVLTMRHSNGAMLRFVPSEEDQLRSLWRNNTNGNNGHPVANRFVSNLVVEGVRIYPRLKVLPLQWNDASAALDNNDGEREQEARPENNVPNQTSSSNVVEDLVFRSTILSSPPSASLLGSGARDAISLCGECGWLYGRVASYVESILYEDPNDDDDDDNNNDADHGEFVVGVHCATSRALASRMDRELAEYHEQLSELEGELPPLSLDPTAAAAAAAASSHRRYYLTLRSLAARLPPIRDRLRTLAIVVDGVGACNLRGGKLLASVLQHSLDGHTQHSRLVRSIAADCSVPWYRLLSQWMTQGVLEDVHCEFFVKEIAPEMIAAAGGGGGGPMASSSLSSSFSSGFFTWHQRYILVEGLIPLCSCGGLMDIITVDLAREVLLVGKGINFIRYCLNDKDWEVLETTKEEEDKTTHCNNSQQHRYNNFATLTDVQDDDDELRCVSTLHDAVMKSSARIHSHILHSLEVQHHMMHHLRALKHFLFLGQGDFVSSFVESLDSEFRGRTSIAGIYSHTLSAVLEGSLRKTNARFLPDFVLGNLRARLMMVPGKDDSDRYWMGPPPRKAKEEEMIPWKENSGASSSIQDPWDFIYLDYKINNPLDAIVHESAMETYHRVFLFLFRLKRVEWMLNNSWRQSTALNHAILIETKAGGADAPAISDAAERSSFLLRRISSTRQTMLHFISNLQNYLMFEVLEGGWEALVHSVKRARTLDDIVRAHDFYLSEIVDKALLRNDDGGEDGGDDGGRSLENSLCKLLSIALAFGKFQDHIFTNSLAGLEKAANIRRQVEERAEKGDWGRKTLDKEEGRVFVYLADPKLFQFVEQTANDFDGALSELLKMMSKQIDEVDCNTGMDDNDMDEKDPVMRNHDALPFLLFRLDFSGYYARQARENRKKKKV